MYIIIQPFWRSCIQHCMKHEPAGHLEFSTKCFKLARSSDFSVRHRPDTGIPKKLNCYIDVHMFRERRKHKKNNNNNNVGCYGFKLTFIIKTVDGMSYVLGYKTRLGHSQLRAKRQTSLVRGIA